MNIFHLWNNEGVMMIQKRYIVYLVFFLLSSFSIDAQVEDVFFNELQEELQWVSAESYVTVATKSKQKISQVPSIISLITEKDIKDNGYLSVSEALSTIPGFYVTQDSYNAHLSVRGVNGGIRGWNRVVKIMINGKNIAMEYDGTTMLGPETIPIELVERIEIIRGPASALYGPNAFLGAINIVTKSTYSDSITVNFASLLGQYNDSDNLTNTANGFQTSLTVSKKIKQFVVNAGAVIVETTMDDQTIGSTSPLMDPANSEYGYFDESSSLCVSDCNFQTEDVQSSTMTLFSQIKTGDDDLQSFTLNTWYQSIKKNTPFMDWSVLNDENVIGLNNYFIHGQFQKKFSDAIRSEINVSYSFGEPTDDDLVATGYGGITYRERDFGYKTLELDSYVMYSGTILNNQQTFGVNFVTDEESLPRVWNLEQEVIDEEIVKTFTNTGIYYQNVFNPFNKLSMILGSRFDSHNIYGDSTNVRTGFAYELSDNTYTKLLYGTSFKAPSIMQLYSEPILLSGGLTGNEDLKPENASTVEAEISTVLFNKYKLSFNSFYNVIENKIDYLYEDGMYKAINMNQIQSYGFETSVNTVLFKDVDFEGVISSQKSTMDDSDNEGDIVDTGGYPSTIIHVGVSRSFQGLGLFKVRAQYVSESRNNDFNEVSAAIGDSNYIIPSYELFHLSYVSHSFVLIDYEFNLNVNVFNVFDTQYQYPGYGNIDYNGVGRSIKVFLKSTF